MMSELLTSTGSSRMILRTQAVLIHTPAPLAASTAAPRNGCLCGVAAAGGGAWRMCRYSSAQMATASP